MVDGIALYGRKGGQGIPDAGGTLLDMSLQTWSGVGSIHLKKDLGVPTSV